MAGTGKAATPFRIATNSKEDTSLYKGVQCTVCFFTRTLNFEYPTYYCETLRSRFFFQTFEYATREALGVLPPSRVVLCTGKGGMRITLSASSYSK